MTFIIVYMGYWISFCIGLAAWLQVNLPNLLPPFCQQLPDFPLHKKEGSRSHQKTDLKSCVLVFESHDWKLMTKINLHIWQTAVFYCECWKMLNICSGHIAGLKIRTSYNVFCLFQDARRWFTRSLFSKWPFTHSSPSGDSFSPCKSLGTGHDLSVWRITVLMLGHIPTPACEAT